MAEQDSAKATPAKAEKAADAPKVVKYTGDAGIREITAAQWKNAGVEDQKTTIWDDSNEYTLPISDFSAEALRVLERDKQIKVQ